MLLIIIRSKDFVIVASSPVVDTVIIGAMIVTRKQTA